SAGAESSPSSRMTRPGGTTNRKSRRNHGPLPAAGGKVDTTGKVCRGIRHVPLVIGKKSYPGEVGERVRSAAHVDSTPDPIEVSRTVPAKGIPFANLHLRELPAANALAAHPGVRWYCLPVRGAGARPRAPGA